MPTEPVTLSTRPPEPAADADYDAICSAVAATARGRWFLAEFARRSRQNDTAQLLSAIARMEGAILGERQQHAIQDANQQVRIELLEMARTIAQTRAEVAEGRATTPALASSAGSADQNIGLAAERLRQIAWTMRACGVDIPASDQIGQIAEMILAADTAHNLDDRRSAKLTEVLHYLEHRIERMLDGHLATSAETGPAANLAPPSDDATGDSPVATMSPAAAPADPSVTAEIRADIEPTPPPVAKETATVAAPTAADATAPCAPDDVVLTTSDRAPAQLSSAALPLAPEPASPVTDVDRESPATPQVQPTAPEQPPVVAAPAMSHVHGPHLPTGTAQRSGEAADGAPEHAPAPSATSGGSSSGGSSSGEASSPDPQQGAAAPTTIAGTPTATAPAHESVAYEAPADESDAITSQVNQDLDSLTLDGPTGAVIADGAGDRAPQQTPSPPIIADGNDNDDPADFLLEATEEPVPPQARVTPPAAIIQPAASPAESSPAESNPAKSNPTKSKPLTALAKIESELRVAALAPTTRTDGPAPKVTPAPAAKPTTPIADGPLAPLMAMSEEERIALFS